MIFVLLGLLFLLYLILILIVRNLEERLNKLSNYLYENGLLDNIEEDFWCQ